ncbi:TetR/AcrR family transcriptional regulator [Sporolactobacillus pectinivorans]|uniref:TetR/AcrR family transcriptional regulator n=1 Tax=Sporolactobacillus pectinivorans TaxID=1591408 RepID=UPI000C257495|nr:TetR/AcrR family transcriptional regulator [Sporolactobacillus pectinivorans]
MSAGKEAAKVMRREQIIDAAEKLFFTKGFERSTMDDVAGTAHFSKRTVYAYFSSKEQLNFEVMIRGYRLLIAMLKKEEQKWAEGHIDSRLEQMAIALYTFSKEYPGYFSAIFSYENAEADFQEDIPDQSLKECYALGEEVFGMLTRLIREGQAGGLYRKELDPVKAALVLWSCMDGIFNTSKVKAGYIQSMHHTSPDSVVAYALQMLIRCIKK